MNVTAYLPLIALGVSVLLAAFALSRRNRKRLDEEPPRVAAPVPRQIVPPQVARPQIVAPPAAEPVPRQIVPPQVARPQIVSRQIVPPVPPTAEPASSPYSYRKRDYLLTAAERSFYGVLGAAVSDEWLIFAKVRLADLVWLPQGTPNRQAQLNRVTPRHVDFVLCHRQALAPVLAIELDDASHEAEARQARDAVVDEVLRTAGLPLLRIAVRRTYSPGDVATLIRHKIAGTADAGTLSR